MFFSVVSILDKISIGIKLMASNYSIFSKGIDYIFKDINCDNKITKAEKVRDKIQSIVKLFKDTLHYTDFELRESEYRQLLGTQFNVTEGYLIALANHTKEYTDDFIRYIKRENNPTVFTLIVVGLFAIFVIVCFFWFIFNSASFFGFFVSFLGTTLTALAIAVLTDYFGRIWLLVDSVNRYERKSLEALSIIQDNSNFIIEELKSSAIDTTTLAENLQDLLVTTEELFKI